MISSHFYSWAWEGSKISQGTVFSPSHTLPEPFHFVPKALALLPLYSLVSPALTSFMSSTPTHCQKPYRYHELNLSKQAHASKWVLFSVKSSVSLTY